MDGFRMFSQLSRLNKLATHHTLFALFVGGGYWWGLWMMKENGTPLKTRWGASREYLSTWMPLRPWVSPVIVVTNTFEDVLTQTQMALCCLPVIFPWAECFKDAHAPQAWDGQVRVRMSHGESDCAPVCQQLVISCPHPWNGHWQLPRRLWRAHSGPLFSQCF